MNGILNVLKPPGMTSFDVVAYLRGILKTKKIGHTGTLDPGAAGVLPVCIGTATRAVEFLMDKDKVYRAEMVLGISTDSQDAEGEITGVADAAVSYDEIIEAARSFTGRYRQVPPMHSAVRVKGKRLYEIAREGRTIEREGRDVVIHSINIIDVKREKLCTGGTLHEVARVIFDVTCSKGTYIRTLFSDIGERLGCGGHMSFLVRTRTGVFDISGALTLEDVVKLHAEGRLADYVTGVEKALDGLKAITAGAGDLKRLVNGAFLRLKTKEFSPGDMVKVFDETGNFAGLAVVEEKENRLLLKMKKRF